MPSDQDLRGTLATQGRVWLRQAVGRDALRALSDLSTQDGGVGGRVAPDTALFRAVEQADVSSRLCHLWPGARPVRLLRFTKDADANWAVPWHQDRIIALRARHEVAGFGNWSRKGGVWHCTPP